MLQGLKWLLTVTAMAAPNATIMLTMGWTSLAHIASAVLWALVSTVLIVLTGKRHRREEWRTPIAVGILAGWVMLGAVILGTSWDVRAVIVVLLVLPGLNFLLLEAVGLTPKPAGGDPFLH